MKSLLDTPDDDRSERPPERRHSAPSGVLGLFDDTGDPTDAEVEPFILSAARPESLAENSRRNGLAFSAGVAFFASVVFMLILGWGADLLLGSSPWGMVGGIVLGSLIGFIQFFRLSSQIFRK